MKIDLKFCRTFQQLTSTAANRATFINSMIAYVRLWKFDGFDIDWEYPAGASDMSQYTAFAKVKKQFSL